MTLFYHFENTFIGGCFIHNGTRSGESNFERDVQSPWWTPGIMQHGRSCTAKIYQFIIKKKEEILNTIEPFYNGSSIYGHVSIQKFFACDFSIIDNKKIALNILEQIDRV